MSSPSGRRKLLIPEVIQTSTTDCGPAALQALLEGFGLPVSYERLREVCQTDVDGTSIDSLEEVARQLGLEAEQLLVPADHLLLDEAEVLPAIVIIRDEVQDAHFIIAWRRHGPLVQVMDPTMGRRWPTRERFLERLYLHALPVPAEDWREWASSEEFIRPLRLRLAALGVTGQEREALLQHALEAPRHQPLATLDAAVRMVAAVAEAGGLRPGQECLRALRELLARAGEEGQEEAIPDVYWCARPLPATPGAPEQVSLRGAVVVRIRRPTGELPTGELPTAEQPTAPQEPAVDEPAPAAPELLTALQGPPIHPARELLRLLRADGVLAPGLIMGALLLAALGVVVEGLLLRSLIDVMGELGLLEQRVAAVGGLLALGAGVLLLELPAGAGGLWLGRRLEARLRLSFLEKLPRLTDSYFRTRLISDLALRAHHLAYLADIPDLGRLFLQASFELVLTTAAIIWLDPPMVWTALAAAALCLGVPLLSYPLLRERNLRVLSLDSNLSRFYLDALLGLVPVRTHGAERAVQREHRELLRKWSAAGGRLLEAVLATETVQGLLGFALVAWLVLDHVGRRSEDIGGVLLLIYFALNLPVLGQQVALACRRYPHYRNILLRVSEPLSAPEWLEGAPASEQEQAHASPGGVAVSLRGVTVRAAGQDILQELDLEVSPGSHVAIVGPSGAGKSSLLGLLLGWHTPASGELLVDGGPLETGRLEALRRQTAWVDPAVQLWNRSLLENLRYGGAALSPEAMGRALEAADLRAVLEKLPQGLQTELGEGGGLVSGGEGQRVRLGRALLRAGVRLVLLDEPFRGLDRSKRHALLASARQLWRGTTLLCVTHDVGETLGFERVLVVEGGRIVEQGPPSELATREGSRYRALLEAEEALRQELWSSRRWRRARLEQGRLATEQGQLATQARREHG